MLTLEKKKCTFSGLGFQLKNLEKGAPGWLSLWSVQLLDLRAVSWSSLLDIEIP